VEILMGFFKDYQLGIKRLPLFLGSMDIIIPLGGNGRLERKWEGRTSPKIPPKPQRIFIKTLIRNGPLPPKITQINFSILTRKGESFGASTP